MPETDVATLRPLVLWAAFACGLLFGAVARRSHFCTMGAVGDVVNFGDWSRARMWVLAVAVAILGFNAMAAAGCLRAADSIYAGSRLLWASSLMGGLMFGFGMVLASGCGSKNLVRLGGGNLKALVVLLVMGLAGWATLRGVTAVLRVHTVDQLALDLGRAQDLPSLLGVSPSLAALPVALLLLLWVLRRAEGRTGAVWLGGLGGLGVGLAVVGLWWVSGWLGFLAEHPETLEPAFLATSSRRMESFSLVAPMAYGLDWLVFFSDKARHLSLGVAAAAGIVMGSFGMALAERSWRWESFGGTQDLANHLAGATLMGVGGVTALGCSIGQGVSGVSTLSLGSFIALAGLVGGAVAAQRYQDSRI